MTTPFQVRRALSTFALCASAVFDDSSRAARSFSLAAIGIVGAGESVLITQGADFRAA